MLVEYIRYRIPHERQERFLHLGSGTATRDHAGTQLIEVEFEEHQGGKATVVLTNRGLKDDGSRRSPREWWEASLDNLDRVLAA